MTDYMTANTINDMFRSLFALLDRAAYYLLGWMYEILFNVASADIFANETVQRFYGRVQMIIGVFMIFKLAVSIIQGIINPDTFTDKKSGFSTIVGRVVFALIMLTVLTPINIPGAQSDYEINLNNNGLLFGTLYELQDRILENNTLGRLILGTDYSATQQGENLSSRQNTWLTKSSNRFTAAILRGFVRINLNNNGTDELEPTHRVCSYIESDVLQAYSRDDATPNEILSLVNASCTDQNKGDTLIGLVVGKAKRLFSGDRYVFAYLPIISTIVAAVFIYILLGEIITIAIRSIKLAVLRLLAPIPIISYIDPKSEKDGAFGAWVKSLTSTYLELFIHLAVIYFVIFLIEDMIVNGLVINTGTGLIGVISAIFIWIGLFFFVKQAPKFIKDILGIKGASSNVGLAGLLGGTAMAVGGGGLKGFALGAMQGTEAATQGYNQGKAVPLGSVYSQNSDLMAKIRTGDKDAKGGILGAMQDRLNYDTRERRARMLGIGNEDMADAKYIKDVREAQAATTKRELDFATQALNSLGPNATAEERASAQQRYEEAYRKNEAYQSAYGKASSDYDKMDKDRAQFGVAPRVSDKRRNKSSIAYRVNGDDYDDNDYTIREGSYRSPLTTNEDSRSSAIGNYTYDQLPDNPKDINNRDDILGEVSGHKRDMKSFSGTTDDSTFGSTGHGAGGGPGGPPPGP